MHTEMMPKISGLLETSLYVADLDRAQRFYHDLFGFEVMLSDERMRAMRVVEGQVLLLFVRGGSDQMSAVPGGVIPPHDGAGRVHLAFAISPNDLNAWNRKLEIAGITVESIVSPPQGGVSLYFRDEDGHLIELATPGLWPNY